jgi:hypothetical protein
MFGLNVPLARWAPQMLAVLRIFVALLYLQSGLSKYFGFPAPPPPNFAAFSLMGLAGVIEIVGSLLLLVGLFTREAAFIMSARWPWRTSRCVRHLASFLSSTTAAWTPYFASSSCTSCSPVRAPGALTACGSLRSGQVSRDHSSQDCGRSRQHADVGSVLPATCVGNPPDRSTCVVRHKQRSVLCNRQCGRSAPHLGAALA